MASSFLPLEIRYHSKKRAKYCVALYTYQHYIAVSSESASWSALTPNLVPTHSCIEYSESCASSWVKDDLGSDVRHRRMCVS
jgi:hypothetical protein